MMSNVLHFKSDEIIIKEKSQTFCFYLIKSGKVILYINYGKDNEHLLGVLSEGKVFGENGLNLMGENLYTAVAYGDTTVVKITRENFKEFVSSHPDSVLGLIQNMTKINDLLKNNINMLVEELVTPEKQTEYMEKMSVDVAKESMIGRYHISKELVYNPINKN